MYVIDARHFLNERGDIGPDRGPARTMADFVTAVIAHETAPVRLPAPGPACFKCRQHEVDTVMLNNAEILWRCVHCATDGSVSNWQGTFWDLSPGRLAG